MATVPENRQEAEMQRIARRIERAFKAFVFVGLLISALVVRAMILKW